LTNIVYSGIAVDNINFNSRLKFRKMFLLYLTNTLAFIFSLGLAIPWVKILMSRYRAANMFMFADDLSQIAARSPEEINASGDAMSDLFDLDIGL